MIVLRIIRNQIEYSSPLIRWEQRLARDLECQSPRFFPGIPAIDDKTAKEGNCLTRLPYALQTGKDKPGMWFHRKE
jgi:hypothetical protein